MKKQPEVTALTRKTLIDTYFDMTARGEKAAVGAITERAGYNRCTFYRYFTDIEQLLFQVESEICDAFQAALAKISFPISPSEIAESFATIYGQYGRYLSVLLGEYGDIRFTRKMKTIVAPFAKQLFIAEGDMEIITDLKVEFVLSAVLAVITKWYDMKQPVSVSDLGKLINSMIPSLS